MAICLSEQQRKKVEENHNLIYGYAKTYNVSVEEHYDLLAIGLCKAIINYDNSKGEISGFAYKCMNNEMIDYFRSFNGKSRVPTECIISYDAPTGNEEEGSNATVLDTITDSHYTDEEVIHSQTYIDMLSLLNEKETKIAMYMEQGMTEKEIAFIMNCSQQNVNRMRNNIKKKLSSFIN